MRSAPRRPRARGGLAVLLARDAVDPDVLATVLAELAGGRQVSVRRLVGPLRDVAGRGHDAGLWPVLAGLLQRLLAAPEVPGMADLLGLAAEIAEPIRPACPIAGLDEFAARRGGTRQLVEARRLRCLLTS